MPFVMIFMALIVLLAALVAIIVGIVLIANSSGKRVGEGGAGACGACGYTTRGVSSFTCPECGADLRAVGITSVSSGGKSTAGLWLLFSGIGVIVLLGLLMVFLLFGDSRAPGPVPMAPPPPTVIDSTSAGSSDRTAIDGGATTEPD